MGSEMIDTNSERFHYMLNWKLPVHTDDRKAVFCDELKGYTFCPYENEREVTDKVEVLSEIEQSCIYILHMVASSKNPPKPTKVPCMIDKRQKNVYVNKQDFNKNWKYIKDRVYTNALSSNTGRNNSFVPVDLSLVEKPQRKAVIGKNNTIEYSDIGTDTGTEYLLSKRVEAMADHKVRFVYSKKNQYIHDKSCELVKHIRNEDFSVASTVLDGRYLCTHCRRKIYIRNAIKSNPKHFEWYLRFFNKGNVSNQQLEVCLYQQGFQLHMNTPEEMIVFAKEESWLIKESKNDGEYNLYHNNYVMVNDNERYITMGRHLQRSNMTMKDILWYICHYSWDQQHLEKYRANENTNI